MSLHNDNALVVALDTSTDMLACAASWIDGQTGETKLVSGDHMCRRHANVELVNTVDGVLAQAGLDRSDVGYYVVGRGPGRLRVCVSASPLPRASRVVPMFRCWACRRSTLALGRRGRLACAASLVSWPMLCAVRYIRRCICWSMRVPSANLSANTWSRPPWRSMSGAKRRTGTGSADR